MHSEYAIGRISVFIIMTSCNRVIILPDSMTSRACSGSRDQLQLQMEKKKYFESYNIWTVRNTILRLHPMVSFLQQCILNFVRDNKIKLIANIN